MQRMHRQQTKDTENTINQPSGGFSLINIQWASFATGAIAIIVCALLFISIIICCWIRTKNIRRTKTRHAQLLDVHAAPQVGLSPSLSQTRGFPAKCHPNSRLLSPLLPRTDGSATPPGGPQCQRPISSQCPLSTDFLSCPFPSFPRLSTTEGTSPSASVGFLAEGGSPVPWIPSLRGTRPAGVQGAPLHRGWLRFQHSWAQELQSCRAGPRGPPFSPRSAPSCPVSFGPPSTAPKVTPSLWLGHFRLSSLRPLLRRGNRHCWETRRAVRTTQSTQSDGSAVPHSGLEAYNNVSSRRPGSVYGLRVGFLVLKFMKKSAFICVY